MAKMPNGFKPVRGKSVTIKLDPPKPAAPKPAAPKPAAPKAPKVRFSPPLTQRKLDRAPEADDVLITTRKSPDIVRTTVRERMTPFKAPKKGR